MNKKWILPIFLLLVVLNLYFYPIGTHLLSHEIQIIAGALCGLLIIWIAFKIQ